MKEKIVIANQLRTARKKFSNEEYKKICSKCYSAYVIEGIVKGKESFKISFGSKYIESFSKRASDWYRYIFDNIYRFFLIHFPPNDDKTFRKYELIHMEVSKPIHVKIPDMPNETILNYVLEKNGFKIVDEHFYAEKTVYDVARA